MKKLIITIFTLIFVSGLSAQSIEVQADYNAVGDCVFSAHNNTQTPVFLHLKFADLENTTFSEPLPYVKKLSPGFNTLFTLLSDQGEVPRFNYEMKVYRSNPLTKIDLHFPYLIPFEEGRKVKLFDVKNIDGFWGPEGLDSWIATGFYATQGEDVFAARNGEVVEIVGKERSGGAASWYHTWNNSVTMLQEDGSLICYHNIIVPKEQLKVGDKVYAGQKFASVAVGADNLILLIYHQSLFSEDLLFVIPEFVDCKEGKCNILNSSTEYTVFHPDEVRGLEMTKKEKKKLLEKRN